MLADRLDFRDCALISPGDYENARLNNSAPRPNDVLFSKDGTVGKVHVVKEGREFAVLSSIAILRPRADATMCVDSGYLGHALRDPRTLDQAMRRKTGSAIRRIILADLKQVCIPLPSLSDQRRIAAILDQAEGLRAKRRQALARLDALTQSIFIEMFGDPATNPKGWPRVALGDLASISSGSTPSRSDDSNFGGDIPWVKTTEVTGQPIRDTEESVTDRGRRNARLKVYPAGSLIIALYGQGRTRGRCSMLMIDATVNQACAVIAPSEAFAPTCLHVQLQLSYDRLRSLARGGNQANLNVGLIESFPVLDLPIKDQLRFAEMVRALTRVRRNFETADSQLLKLTASIQHRAFRGDL
jgi:type I restriction enzyme S subunit